MSEIASLSSDGYFRWHCPGCECSHLVSVHPQHPNGWTLAGGLELPTLSPSILVHGNPAVPETDYPGTPRCHSFVRAGRIEFLADCDHALASSTVPMVALS